MLQAPLPGESFYFSVMVDGLYLVIVLVKWLNLFHSELVHCFPIITVALSAVGLITNWFNDLSTGNILNPYS